jgi:hypothetical protein
MNSARHKKAHLDDLARKAMKGVTRIVLVQNGAYTEFWAGDWRADIKDEGKTLKLFASGSGQAAKDLRDRELASWLKTAAVTEPGQ